ncbi:DUF7946 domain-containing protein [Pseudomonas sp. EA_15y_Pfl1_P101]|uniref:DUF7946 domain-containing protein n=1 Tax=Pseudomonas sp. EA_15y_Pfl1_P101 TaxID=3088684 RepID=UPI0030DCBF42
MKELNFKISYSGGSADQGLLDIYDASVSTQGLARALSVTTHAFINEGQIRKRAERVAGAKVYLHPPKNGSFEELVTIVFTDPVVQFIGASVITPAFWDFLKWTWSEAIGGEHIPETPFVRRLADRVEPLIGEIGVALESPMASLHRPIQNAANIEISISRPRVGEMIRLDHTTMAYVSIRDEGEPEEGIIGNVTKYNILSGYGRVFVDELDRTIPFDLDIDVSPAEKEFLTKSSHDRNRGLDGKISLNASRILTGRGELKRFKVYGVEWIGNIDI